MLDASADESCLAVRLYNDPAERRSFEAFVVHMHLAWLYLFHAELAQAAVDFRYRDPQHPTRLARIDGEPKRWDLSKCVTERLLPDDPTRANLEFFIALRNRIEHRHSRNQEALTLALGGHSQALLINYQDRVTRHFGDRWSLATRLRFPVFIGTFNEAGTDALVKLQSKLPKDLRSFIATYHADLDPSTAADQRFNFRLRVVLEQANRDPDALAIQFTRLEDLTPDQQTNLAEWGRTGHVIVRDRNQPVANLDRLKPSVARGLVEASIPFRFTQHDFTLAYRTLKVRPPNGAPNPARTHGDFCVYDPPHNDYLYSQAYVKYLVSRLATVDGYHEVVGRAPVAKDP